MKAITCPGTGLGIVEEIVKTLDGELIIAESINTVRDTDWTHAILLGGQDINPALYGAHRWSYTGTPNKRRDSIEWTIARTAYANNRPLMGICRGHQMIVAAFGGTLYQDIKREYVATFNGAVRSHKGGKHRLTWINHRFQRYLAAKNVNSYHHQAMNIIPPGFMAMAYAPDGIVEAIWRNGILGVQFHPELMFPYNPCWIGLFRWWKKGLTFK